MTKPNAAYQIKANPPHYGNILELVYHMNKFDKIYVVIYDKPTLLSSEQVAEMLRAVLNRIDKDKFVIIVSDVDFAHMNELPEVLIENKVTHIITASDEVYANLTSKGLHILHPKQ